MTIEVLHFFVGMTLEGIILGSLVTVAASIFNLPYAGMLGVIAGVMALIPIIGGYISAAVGTLMLLAVSPSQALFYLVMVIKQPGIDGHQQPLVRGAHRPTISPVLPGVEARPDLRTAGPEPGSWPRSGWRRCA